ncbi:tetratricopeptide repeat protein, partial [Roseomonas harenae]|uniref:tetratricopeptide repeat protein n=1 Tax=Muricoccus harenae TaxID=2692566 RepID=UPI001F2BB476
MVLDYAKEDEEARFDNRGAAPPPFIAAARRFLHEQLGLLPSLTFKDDPAVVATLEAAVDDALAGARQDSAAEVGRNLVAEAEQAVWQELVNGAGGAPPPHEFKARFFSVDSEAPGWSACFLAFFREALKVNPRVEVAFVASRLAALKQSNTKIDHLVRGIAGDTTAMHSLLGHVANEVATLHGKQDQAHAKLNEIARTLERLQRDPSPDLAVDLRRVLTPQVPNLEFIPDERLPAVIEKLLADMRAPPVVSPNVTAPIRDALDAAEAQIAAFNLSTAAGNLDALIARRRKEHERRAADDAALLAERARISRLQLRYREAAAILQEAASLVASDQQAAWRHIMAAASALQSQGSEYGDNAALNEALALYADALRLVSRRERPQDWAATQINLGNALTILGKREAGTARLEEAADAFRAALQECTCERVPLKWAMAQNNLGYALWTLGRREAGTARFEEAADAFRAALQGYTRERVPLKWATTQNNLGNALWILGEREAGTARLEEVVDAYRAALQERTREHVPLEWAATQKALGNVLTILGGREAGTARLEEAVGAFRAALQERTRERVPLEWAAIQTGLGNALTILGKREAGTARLEEAVGAFRAALQECTRERVPLEWAAIQTGLGNALAALGEREAGTARLEEAVGAFRAALQERTRERVPLEWAMAQKGLAYALLTLGRREVGTARLEEAVGAFRAALQERTRERVPL